MGWTTHRATNFYPSGQINRKAECDDYLQGGLNRGYYKVLRSTMKGSVYYAAVMALKRKKEDANGNVIKDVNGNARYEDIPEAERPVSAYVILTYAQDSTRFGYKVISETSGPFNCDCPKGILDLLTPTDNEYAQLWRKECYKNLSKPTLSSLPIGTEIEVEVDGKRVVLRKSAPRYQFKTPFWINDADFTYMAKKRISKNFKIIYDPRTKA